MQATSPKVGLVTWTYRKSLISERASVRSHEHSEEPVGTVCNGSQPESWRWPEGWFQMGLSDGGL